MSIKKFNKIQTDTLILADKRITGVDIDELSNDPQRTFTAGLAYRLIVSIEQALSLLGSTTESKLIPHEENILAHTTLRRCVREHTEGYGHDDITNMLLEHIYGNNSHGLDVSEFISTVATAHNEDPNAHPKLSAQLTKLVSKYGRLVNSMYDPEDENTWDPPIEPPPPPEPKIVLPAVTQDDDFFTRSMSPVYVYDKADGVDFEFDGEHYMCAQASSEHDSNTGMYRIDSDGDPTRVLRFEESFFTPLNSKFPVSPIIVPEVDGLYNDVLLRCGYEGLTSDIGIAHVRCQRSYPQLKTDEQWSDGIIIRRAISPHGYTPYWFLVARDGNTVVLLSVSTSGRYPLPMALIHYDTVACEITNVQGFGCEYDIDLEFPVRFDARKICWDSVNRVLYTLEINGKVMKHVPSNDGDGTWGMSSETLISSVVPSKPTYAGGLMILGFTNDNKPVFVVTGAINSQITGITDNCYIYDYDTDRWYLFKHTNYDAFKGIRRVTVHRESGYQMVFRSTSGTHSYAYRSKFTYKGWTPETELQYKLDE